MFLRNCWYVAAWLHELEEGKLLARTLLSDPLVFFMRSDGSPVALIDRCCHRAAPLSAGRQEGDNLRCLYHGLVFDPSGKCIEIPGQQLIPPKARVRSFPVVARDKVLWIWMGSPDLADPALIPELAALEDPKWRHKPGYFYYKANYQYIIDNVLDFSHLSFVHSNTLGGTDLIAKSRPTVETFDRGVRIKRYMINGPQPPFTQRFATMGNVDRWHFYELLVPGIMRMESGMQPTGTGVMEGRHENALEFRAYNLVTPETERTSHYFFALAHGFGLDDPSVTQGLFEEVTKAFVEDGAMIEAQQRVIDASESFTPVPIFADAGLMEMRRLMDRMADAERGMVRGETPTTGAASISQS